MAIFVAVDNRITINGVNFSDHLTAVTMDISADEQDVTTFGGSGYRTRIAGLKDASIQLDFNNDFAASSVDSTLWGLFGTNATVVVTPTSGTVSATNPSYTGVYLVSSVQPFANTVGDVATLSVTWPLAGTAGVVRGTV